VEVRVTREVDASSYRRLLADDRSATFFHTAEWSSFLQEALSGCSPETLVARNDDEIIGALPFMTRTKIGLKVLESMPFGTYGGPVVTPGGDDVAAALVAAFAKLAKSPGVAMAQLVDVSGRELDPAGAFERTSGTMQVVDLSGGFESVLSGFRPSARNKLKKARKAGVTVRRGQGAEDFSIYFTLLEKSAARWGTPAPHGRRFFERLADVEHDGVQLWLAEHEGTVIGGDLNFALNGMIMNWGNASSDAGRRLATNNLLHAHAMRVGAEGGYRSFNMGASQDLPGVAAFKRSLGAQVSDYTILRITTPLYRAAQWASQLGGGHGGRT